MKMILIHITTALRQLIKNSGRSMLTMLGIIIGIGSVIFIMTTGEIAKNFLISQISQFGTNVVEVAPPSVFGFGESEKAQLQESDIQALEDSSLLPELNAIAGGYSVVKEIETRLHKESVSIMGDRPDFFELNNMDPVEGRIFTDADVSNGSRVIVIDSDLAKDLFQNKSSIGKQVRVEGAFFSVVGVVEPISLGGVNIGNIPSFVYIPISTVKRLFADSADAHKIDYLLVGFEQGTNIDSFTSRLKYELHRIHGFTDEDEATIYTIVSREQALAVFDSILIGIQAFVSAIAAISLVVGGIGIMNIMLVTVKERTKEIGLRKAIGARNSSVLAQFLIESIVLTTVGGIIGISVGLGLSYGAVGIANIVQPSWELHFVFVPQALVLATGVAATVGIVFGLYPAFKASRLRPIEALRYE